MDPLSASCYTLNCETSKTQQKYSDILGSTVTISNYEKKNLRNLTPQILAAIIVTSYHISIGISLAYSAILIPQLEANPEFEVTKSAESWIASIVALTNPVGSLIVGILMDNFGRLKTLALAGIPGISGCILMALSQNIWMLIAGRGLIGLSSALGSSPAIVYLTEIARKDMRGSLISIAPALTSLGMVLTFIMGWFLNWRQVAWLTTVFTGLPCLLVILIPESPAWLVSQNRMEEAKKSLIWINKYQPQPINKPQTYPELQLVLLQKDHELKMIQNSKKPENEFQAKLYEFMKPTGYKPLIILTGLFFFQQFSGIFIFLFYSIQFFQEVGSQYNPYLTSIFIGIVRFVMSMVNTYVQRTFGRRILMLLSCLAMTFCIVASGFYTSLVKNGKSELSWLPVVFLLLFVVASMMGVIPIPYSMTAEVFPLEIRGVAHSISICLASFLMFLSLQLYPTLFELFGNITNLQYFFGCISLGNAIYVWIALPETQGKKLSEIEDYFKTNIIYIGQKTKNQQNNKIIQSNIVKKNEQEESLLV